MTWGILTNISPNSSKLFGVETKNAGLRSASDLEMKIDIIEEKFNVIVYDKWIVSDLKF